MLRKKIQLSIHVSREIRDATKKAADDDNRSMASLASIALVEFLQRKGLLPLPKKATK
jgi:hypothetical protein